MPPFGWRDRPTRARRVNRSQVIEGGVERIWAPWRLEYIQSADEDGGCVFCDALAGDDDETLVIHRGERAFVLLNRFPYTSGHLMVAPSRHVGEFLELEAGEAAEIHRLVQDSLRALAETMSPHRY